MTISGDQAKAIADKAEQLQNRAEELEVMLVEAKELEANVTMAAAELSDMVRLAREGKR